MILYNILYKIYLYIIFNVMVFVSKIEIFVKNEKCFTDVHTLPSKS